MSPLPEQHSEMGSRYFSLNREPKCPVSVCQQKGSLLGLPGP